MSVGKTAVDSTPSPQQITDALFDLTVARDMREAHPSRVSQRTIDDYQKKLDDLLDRYPRSGDHPTTERNN